MSADWKRERDGIIDLPAHLSIALAFAVLVGICAGFALGDAGHGMAVGTAAFVVAAIAITLHNAWRAQPMTAIRWIQRTTGHTLSPADRDRIIRGRDVIVGDRRFQLDYAAGILRTWTR